jgi:hypothetical protein
MKDAKTQKMACLNILKTCPKIKLKTDNML